MDGLDLGKASKPGLLFGDYKVEKITDPNPKVTKLYAYLLTGKRASYYLIRNKPNPQMLFPVSTKGFIKNCKVRGYGWFYEAPCGRIIPSH